MMGSILGAHSPLFRDYPNQPSPPPAPPAPPTPPSPPQSEPIAFSAVTRASLFGVIGSAISSTTLATITCADAAMTIALSEAVGGLTFSYSAGVLSVSGTPTGSTRVQRVVVSYISSDGNATVRGSTTHEITLVKASETLTIGTIAGVTGRVGFPLSQVVCTPTANFDADVLCFGTTALPGVSVGWSWNKAGRTGTLTLAGTPTQTFGPDGGFQFSFIANGQELGTGTTNCTIVQRYEALAPAPAPVPAPPAPSPSPPPAPTPAPAPGRGPDALLSSVKVLLHFDGADPGTNSAAGQPTFTSVDCSQASNPGLGMMQRFGYSEDEGWSTAAGLSSKMEATVAGLNGTASSLTAECLVDLNEVCWDAHREQAGAVNRYTPVMSLISSDSRMVWTLGFLSTSGLTYSDADTRRVVMTVLVQQWANGALNFLSGNYLTDFPGRFIHLAAQRTTAPGLSLTYGWTDGQPWVSSGSTGADFLDPASTTCRLGNTCPGLTALSVFGGVGVELIPFVGSLDEVRATAAARYGAYIGATLPPAARVIPWPNY